ncbi:stalk domain-containing protein [Saccharibacillus sp. CPCC 101409]|uniref:stalk domain-containing protein n=1 Tax=Saccharibacillus sp. CPCC 101409 TaxID=3058041 RepID=UPI0026712DC3|nr:stalk domain-containing protein [Saccharibacillus sp. CPCC 101409]MDO3408796.1 stalk domain-containing protein [Saccharibacillus sp. CPCC 101409]
MLKKLILSVCAAAGIGLSGSAFISVGHAESVVRIDKSIVDPGEGNATAFLEKPVYIVDGRIMLPIRELGRYAGIRTFWDAKTKTASLREISRVINLKIGSKTASVDGRETALDVPARLINGDTYIPLKFVAKALNLTVTWDSASRTVNLPAERVIGSEGDVSFLMSRDLPRIFKAVGQKRAILIGKTKMDYFHGFDLQVKKLSDTSEYLTISDVTGPSNRVRQTERMLVTEYKIVKDTLLSLNGDYPDTSLDKSGDRWLFTDGKKTEFVDREGRATASYDFARIMNQTDKNYLVEYANPKFLIVREYESQHLILYNLNTKQPVYLHEVLNLPQAEKDYLIRAGEDRYNEAGKDTIIKFVKSDNDTASFRYTFSSDGKIHTYTYKLN